MTSDSFSEKRVHEGKLQLDPKHAAVLVVDMLNEFLEQGGKMVLEGGHVLYAPIRELLDAAHRAGVPVFWLNQTLHPGDKLFEKRVVHCIAGSWGAQVVDALPKGPEDITVPKRRYSGFFQTDLDLYLRERKIESVIVTGVVTNICVRSTIHDAFFLGYDVVVPVECVAATSPMQQESSLYDIETHYGTVTTLDEVLGQLDASRTPSEIPALTSAG
jgi:ureidoacrylate peracid hydrolase